MTFVKNISCTGLAEALGRGSCAHIMTSVQFFIIIFESGKDITRRATGQKLLHKKPNYSRALSLHHTLTNKFTRPSTSGASGRMTIDRKD